MPHRRNTLNTGLARRALICIAVALAVSACETIATRNASPFRLFDRDDMRAGIPFSIIEEASRRESPIRWNCWDTLPAQKMRMCRTTVSPGDLFALVAPDKRIVRLLFVSYEPTRLEENYQSDNFKRTIATAQQMMASFDSVMPRRTLPGQPVEFRWVESTPRYSAAMWFMPRDHYLRRSRNEPDIQQMLRRLYADSLALVPDSVAITDEREYGKLVALNPRPVFVPDEPADFEPVNVAPLPPSPADRVSSMRSELERLARMQETYFADKGKYAMTLDELGFAAANGVVVELGRAAPAGYVARSTHPVMLKAVCVIYGGNVKQLPEAGQMGAPGGPGFATCDPG